MSFAIETPLGGGVLWLGNSYSKLGNRDQRGRYSTIEGYIFE
jgi:hypothetical protein